MVRDYKTELLKAMANVRAAKNVLDDLMRSLMIQHKWLVPIVYVASAGCQYVIEAIRTIARQLPPEMRGET